MPISHCLPTGSLGTLQIPVPNVSGMGTMYLPAGGAGLGNIRGIIVELHGFPIVPISTPITIATPDSFTTNVNLDGWAVYAAAYPEDFTVNNQPTGARSFISDVQNDSGFGSRYLAMTNLWWEHLIQYIRTTFGPWPLVPFGISWGGFHSILRASVQQSTLLGYIAHVPATNWQNSSPTFTPNDNLWPLMGSVAQLGATALNAVTIPGLVSYGTRDQGAGFDGNTTVQVGFTTTPAASVTSLPLTTVSGFYALGAGGPLVTVTTSGGTGTAIYSYTSISGGALQGMTLLIGSGNVVAGAQVVQSLTATIVANQQAAQPGTPVALNVTADFHEFTAADASAATFPTGLGSPTTMTSLAGTNLGIAATTNNRSNLVSGACAVWGSDNAWHNMTFTNTPLVPGGATTLNAVTFSSPGSATISNTSPITQTNLAVGAGIPWWINQVLSPLAPRLF